MSETKRWTEVLCQKCGGNGVIRIPGGVSECSRCKGRCYEPEADQHPPTPDEIAAIRRHLAIVRSAPMAFESELADDIDTILAAVDQQAEELAQYDRMSKAGYQRDKPGVWSPADVVVRLKKAIAGDQWPVWLMEQFEATVQQQAATIRTLREAGEEMRRRAVDHFERMAACRGDDRLETLHEVQGEAFSICQRVIEKALAASADAQETKE